MKSYYVKILATFMVAILLQSCASTSSKKTKSVHGKGPLINIPEVVSEGKKEMRKKVEAIATREQISLKKGVYASVVGPQLETKAEYRMLKIMGADAVGMSTVPEVIVANHLRLPIIAVSVLTDECDPDNLQTVNIQEIIEIAGNTEPKMVTLFRELIKEI